MVRSSDIVVWLKDVDREDVTFVGSKSANLGELIQSEFPVPNGFAITTQAFSLFLKANKLDKPISHLLNTINYNDPNSVRQVSSHIKKVINSGNFPTEVSNTIVKHYSTLERNNPTPLVAVRSLSSSKNFSETDPGSIQETFLNISGETTLLQKIKEAWISLYDAKAIYHRHLNKTDQLKVKNAITVQKMIESESSGVMFSIDPVLNSKNTIVIEAIYGLGEYLDNGKVDPDHFKIDKQEVKIIEKRISRQEIMMVKARYLSKEVKVNRKLIDKQKISDNYILKLAEYTKKLDKHYFFPQICEWAIAKGKIYLVETKPVTQINSTSKNESSATQTGLLSQYKTKQLLIAEPANPGIGIGPVIIINNSRDIGKVKSGDIVVYEKYNQKYIPALRKASAIISEKDGKTSQSIVLAKNFGIPAVIGASNATKILKNNTVVTVNGKTGNIISGSIKISNNSLSTSSELNIKTSLLVNISNPNSMQELSALPVDGVGLLKAEKMISSFGIHPKKLIHEKKSKEYINVLADGIGQICKNFYPKPVFYRLSDLESNDYRKLKGGNIYEPEESNPLLGYRGTYRHINDPRVLELELKAIRKVRDKMKLNNINILIPYIRTVKELESIKSIIYKSGLRRSSTFKIYMMCELPSNVILIEDFIKAGIDGVSIGSDDLTSLIMGIDSENDEMSIAFDERNPAVLWAFEHVIKKCTKNKVPVSICGEAPSKYPDLVEKFVDWGIDSISVSPEAVSLTREYIYKAEKRK